MRRRAATRVIAVGAALLGATAMAGGASAQPDLVIQPADSQVTWGSCDEGAALAEGRIVIRNEGTSDANLRSADDFFRSFVAVYVPENIDLIEKDTKRTKVEPGEQRAITFTIGKGKKKAGRNYNAFASGGAAGFPTEKDWLKNTAKYKEQIIAVQKLLVSRGYFLGKTGPDKDGADGSWGGASVTALKNFQQVQKLKATGTWDAETAAVVAGLIQGGKKPVIENIKNEKGETQITLFAVVDPYNLIDESNEKNNILAYTGYLKCD
ncbi:MAG: peptidoglycan-binding protein [Hyphomicrobiaceae bacterium]|nr:peptidoglycan-binding protein [Hyphomicrobiaceae bacterium]